MATVHRYVDTDSGSNGNAGTSYGAAWADANHAFDDAVTNKSSSDTWYVHLRGNAADSTQIVVDSVANTTSANPLIFTCDSGETNGRHVGLWDTSKYLHSRAGQNVAISAACHVVFDGMQFENTNGWGSQPKIISGAVGTGSVTCTACLFDLSGSQASLDEAVCLAPSDNAAYTWRAINCVCRRAMSFFRAVAYADNAGLVLVFYNNTLYGLNPGNVAYGGIYMGQDGGNAYVKNNIIELAGGATGPAYNAAGAIAETTSNNLTSDGSLGSTGTASFVNAAAGDFHLSAADGGGTDLSADAIYAVTTDIDGVTRAGTWDRGADEYAAVAAGNPWYYYAQQQ